VHQSTTGIKKRAWHAFGWVGCLCLVAGCIKSRPCVNIIREEDPSPSGRFKAVVFERRCPDMGQRTTQISILKGDGSLADGNGNIFAGDEPILVKVGWQGNGKLIVYSLADLSKATRLMKAGDIVIEYEQMMETYLLPPLNTPGPADSPSAGNAAPVPSATPSP
jgi:hypothetical protein